eukprot:6637352-Pyramimonas_sp.AAC.1
MGIFPRWTNRTAAQRGVGDGGAPAPAARDGAHPPPPPGHRARAPRRRVRGLVLAAPLGDGLRQLGAEGRIGDLRVRAVRSSLSQLCEGQGCLPAPRANC